MNSLTANGGVQWSIDETVRNSLLLTNVRVTSSLQSEERQYLFEKL